MFILAGKSVPLQLTQTHSGFIEGIDQSITQPAIAVPTNTEPSMID